jgi:hypothetical protein
MGVSRRSESVEGLARRAAVFAARLQIGLDLGGKRRR